MKMGIRPWEWDLMTYEQALGVINYLEAYVKQQEDDLKKASK